MMVGVIGASAVALVFLLVDALQGEPLFTPSLIADRLLGRDGDAHALPIDLARISATVVLHGALFVALESGFLLASAFVIPGTASAIGQLEIVAANALPALAMALYLRRSPLRPAHPDGSVVRLRRQRTR